jgi:hypothetical protein
MLKQAQTDVKENTGLVRPKARVDALKTVPRVIGESGKAEIGQVVNDQSSQLNLSSLVDSSTAVESIAGSSAYIDITPTQPRTSTPAPMSDSRQTDLRMLSLASGNSKKAKSLRRDLANGRRQINKKIVYEDNMGDASQVTATATLDSSMLAVNTSAVELAVKSAVLPVVVSAVTAKPQTSTPKAQTPFKPANFFQGGITKRPPPPPPSTRSDLPSNVFVTSVNVEAEDFVPGVATPNFIAPPQVPYYAQSSENQAKIVSSIKEQAAAPANVSDYLSAYSGYYGSTSTVQPMQQNGTNTKGKPNKKKQKESLRAKDGLIESDAIGLAAKFDETGWKGWPSAQDLEGELFESYKKISAPSDGEMVALKVSIAQYNQIRP